MTLRLNGSDIPIDGSSHILITRINPTSVRSSSESLNCISELDPIENTIERGDWTLNNSTILESKDPRGWTVDSLFSGRHQRARLTRASDVAVEGEFTCHMGGDINPFAYVGIYYPSELKLNV